MQKLSEPLPFVDFYRSHNISPVSQDISDLGRHYGRRESLYRLLGIPARMVRGLDVLELCPGSGYNSIYTQSLAPRSYVLVEANEHGLSISKELFARYHPDARNVSFVSSLVSDYHPDHRFDVVLCEGAIPLQLDPIGFTQDLSRFVAPAGILVITCSDAVSFIGECGRRLIANKLTHASSPIGERLELLRPIFAEHLALLKGVSRPVDDWIMDNILQPFIGKVFSISEAVSALDAMGFEFYGSSPDFVVDWRWYKELTPGQTDWNQHAITAFRRNTLNFLDYRFIREPQSEAFGEQLSALCNALFTSLQEFENTTGRPIEAVLTHLDAIVRLTAPVAPETSEALESLSRFMHASDAGVASLHAFAPLFGRGQQYLSFIAPSA